MTCKALLVRVWMWLWLLPSVAAGQTPHSPDGSSPRVRYTVNEGWRYAPGPQPNAPDPDLDDSGWTRVHLPHTWNAVDAFDKETEYRRGVGWYRKRLETDSLLLGKRVFLLFEGANQVADVFLNGQRVGQHIGGYTAFSFDVTDVIGIGRPNTIAVRVDNSHDDDIPPLDADFTFYGGIYRDMWLIATEPVHIDVTDHGSPGIFIDTPEVSEDAATVRIRGTVLNESPATQAVQINNKILDLDGIEIVSLNFDVTIEPGGRASFEQISMPVRSPRLWSPDAPHLYRVVTQVIADGVEVDRLISPLGIRWADVDAQSGFHLNGKPLRLNGTNRHQDLPGLGNALPDDAHRRDVGLIKWNGFNFLRLAHYPQDPAVLDETDRVGLVVWEEIPVVNTITMSEAFFRNAERMLVEMIRQHYNHPSILMWGYMNEIMLREPKPLPAEYRDSVMALGRKLESVVRREDPYRLTATAISHGEVDNGTGFQDIPDVLGMNLYFGWYYHEFETFGEFLDDLHRRNPGRPLFISEYGAGSDERVRTDQAVRFDFSSDYAQAYHRSQFRIAEDRPYLVGTAVWNQFDFGSAHRQDTKNAINQKGLFFFDRTPKDIAYYYRARLVDEPVLHIARESRHRVGSRPMDALQRVLAYSNADSVELFVDGRSMGWSVTDNATAMWDVTLQSGDNLLQAEGSGGAGLSYDEVVYRYVDRVTLFDPVPVPGSEIAVNAGAHYEFVDAFGTAWEADRPYGEESWGFVGGGSRRIHHRIYGTPDDPLFQAFREGGSYRFDVPDGTYELELGFVEPDDTSVGSRLFDVLVNGRSYLGHIDLAREAGRWRAARRKLMIEVNGGDGIRIDMVSESGEGVVSSIRIRRK